MRWFAQGSASSRKHFRPPSSRLEISSRNARRPRVDPRPVGRGHGRSAQRRQRDTAPGLQGQERGPAGDRIAPGVVSLVAELRGHDAQGSASRQCRGRRRSAAVGWRDRLESDPRRGRQRRRWATEPQQLPSAGTWTWSSTSDLPTWSTSPVAGAGCWRATPRARKQASW